jgi:hypothetical protein
MTPDAAESLPCMRARHVDWARMRPFLIIDISRIDDVHSPMQHG